MRRSISLWVVAPRWAATADGEHEARIGRKDDNWPD